MYMRIHGELREVIVTKKRGTKNTYMRVKEDGKIYVSTNLFTTDRAVSKILEEHVNEITRMADIIERKNDRQKRFFFLGKEYDPIQINGKEVQLGEEKVLIGKDASLEEWYLQMARPLFQKHLDYYYDHFKRVIPYPRLRIRKMKSRWGVCNTRLKTITLNLELIKRDIACLDYVIVHELSHLVHANHSKAFWQVVEEHYPDYKKVRKHMKEE